MQEQTTGQSDRPLFPQVPRDEFMDRFLALVGQPHRYTLDQTIAIATMQLLLDIRDRLPPPPPQP
jgi:hypothetical protein